MLHQRRAPQQRHHPLPPTGDQSGIKSRVQTRNQSREQARVQTRDQTRVQEQTQLCDRGLAGPAQTDEPLKQKTGLGLNLDQTWTRSFPNFSDGDPENIIKMNCIKLWVLQCFKGHIILNLDEQSILVVYIVI